MADLTKNDFPVVRQGPELLTTMPVKDALVIYAGALCAISGPNAAASNGYVVDHEQVAGLIPLGILNKKVTGDSDGTPVPPSAEILLNSAIVKKAVTGVDGINDVGKPVYASDNQTYTLTRPSNKVLPSGMVLEHLSGTSCWILLFGVDVLAAMAIGGGERQLLALGNYQWAAIANGDLRTAIPMQGHGKIVGVFAMVDEVMVGAGGTVDVNLEIGGTDVTGGVVTVSTAAGGTRGTKLAGTAVTAANVFHEGDALDVEAANAGGTRTSGTFDLYAVVERQFGV